MAQGLLGNLLPQQGLLSQFFGPADPGPLADILAPVNYSANNRRAAGLTNALYQASDIFLHPDKGGSDLGQLGRLSTLGRAYHEGETGYNKELTQDQLVNNKLWADQRAKQLAEEEDLQWADVIAQHPEWAGMGRAEARKLMADIVANKEGVLGGGKTDYSMGNMVEAGVWEDGTTKYVQWQPSYRKGVPPRVEVMPKGFVPFGSPEGKGKAAGEVEDAKTFSNKKANAQSIEDGVIQAQSHVQDILNDPNMKYFTGYTGIFGKDVFKMPQYIGFEAKIAPLLAFQFKAFMNESGVHSQISDQDREAMSALVAKIVPGMPEAQLKSALMELDNYFVKVRMGNRKYLEGEGPSGGEGGGGGTPDTSHLDDPALLEHYLPKVQ